MRIDNAQLAAFAAVLGEGSFELAARKLSVTPSAVSQRIKLLEDRLGQVLIQRSTPCRATAAGRRLLRHAEQVALLESEVLSELGVAEGSGQTNVRIPIVVNADSLDSWFAEVFDALPGVTSITLDIRSEDQDHSVALLREGTVMAGVSASAEAIQGCRVEALGAMRYLAVASPAYVDRYFAAGVSADTLNTAPVLMFNKKDALQRLFVARLTGTVLQAPTHCAPSTRSFLEAARRGAAWGMMPEQIVAAALRNGDLLEMVPDHWLDIPLYWHCWRIGSSALDVLSKLVCQAAGRSLHVPESA